MAIEVYSTTRTFPKEERFGLTSQLRRAAVSVGANIAEGTGRRSDGEMCRFLHIAYGSASELEHHFLLAHDLGMLKDNEFNAMTGRVDEVQRMLTALMKSVRSSAPH